ncbi:sulfotransferase domain-containing protein (plasmid) [Priestia megaterium]|uniref:sulfotransferase domain-containing protein n=1 Tax=Priestia megaterium TaxID=1404 RepID=UPI001EDAA6F6|nr:sulfotransferase domain-containing protein [Priestia megaterium]UKJ83555.1 sulfotransferase domain-containing protein [Priestia megaterium]
MENFNIVTLPKVLINSVPKSGTHLLLQIILGIPGMEFAKANFNSFVFYAEHYKEVKTIKNGNVALGHLPYNVNLASDMNQEGIKHIFITRDLRDVTVSYMYFIINQCPEHIIYRYFTEYLKTNEERLHALINGIQLYGDDIENYGFSSFPNILNLYGSIYNWRGKQNLCELRYEDLVRNEDSQKQELLKIIDYLWDDLQHLNLAKVNLFDFMKNNINPETSWSFRKGKIGSWRDIFTKEHKKSFKDNAGKFLIDFGYEKDYNW